MQKCVSVCVVDEEVCENSTIPLASEVSAISYIYYLINQYKFHIFSVQWSCTLSLTSSYRTKFLFFNKGISTTHVTGMPYIQWENLKQTLENHLLYMQAGLFLALAIMPATKMVHSQEAISCCSENIQYLPTMWFLPYPDQAPGYFHL